MHADSTGRYADTTVPAWLDLLLRGLLSVVVGFGLIGLVLAIAGLFMPAIVVPVAAAASVTLFLCSQPPHDRVPTSAPRLGSITAIGAALIALASGVVNVTHAAQHVLIDRDPGAYINTGRWLATHHGLSFRADLGPFAGVHGLMYSSPAVYGHGPTMHFQFSHLLGVLLAEARWLGGDRAMFALTPVLGAVAILAFYVLACRFVRPTLALLATAALAVNVVQLHFSRDAYSEILQQLVLLGALWMFGSAQLGARRSFFVGVLLGTTVAARIDGPLFLASVPVLVGLAIARRRRSGETRAVGGRRGDVVAFVAGVVLVTAIGLADIELRVPEYARYIGPRVLLQYIALALLIAGAVLLGRTVERWHPILARREWLPTAAGVAAAVALLAMWFVRPHVLGMRGKEITLVAQIQRADHLHFDPALHYFQDSMRWHAWYLGPPALVAGIVGFAWLVRETIRRGTTGQWVLLVSFGAISAVYLWNASITPDQLWVMRRFVPIGFPGFVLFAVMVCELLVVRFARTGLIGAIALAGVVLAWPVSATVKIPADRTEPGMLGALTATCRALGPHAAVILLRSDNAIHLQLPQPLRGYCGVPVARKNASFDPAEFATLARAWRAAGRTLTVVSDTPANITDVLPAAHPRVVASVTNRHLVEQTLNRPPRHYVTNTFTITIADVPLAAPVAGG